MVINDGIAECPYCGADVTIDPDDENLPTPTDQYFWSLLAREHNAECEWVESRGFQID